MKSEIHFVDICEEFASYHEPLQTAKEIGALTGASETTVIRFCFALGCSGYGMLREQIHKLLLMPKQQHNPLHTFIESAGVWSDGSASAQHVVERVIASLSEMLAALDSNTLRRAKNF
ncbi:MurR/RpiR family transcriptional regulator [Paenibacillus cymbidii]|uniref:MurR/RpiR family transcriptional regulator n=1 Tax=Paenibacillus cymbidii TaxID=1639034 RepID=UPI001080C2E1|nr:hypothetical protein [Paenibacillus cymbidii]